MTLFLRTIETPLRPVTAVIDEAGALRLLAFDRDRELSRLAGTDIVEDEGRGDQVALQLGEYFAGRRRTFELDLEPGGTAFQRQVWGELVRIPWGRTISYRELAERVGRPAAWRAVGRANGTNPLPIVIPCHRVLASDGSLGGYGGGLEWKRWLLAHEGALLW